MSLPTNLATVQVDRNSGRYMAPTIPNYSGNDPYLRQVDAYLQAQQRAMVSFASDIQRAFQRVGVQVGTEQSKGVVSMTVDTVAATLTLTLEDIWVLAKGPQSTVVISGTSCT